MAISIDNDIFVSCRTLILVLDINNFKLKSSIRYIPSIATYFKNIRGIAVSGDGRIFVTDPSLKKIFVFGRNLKYKFHFKDRIIASSLTITSRDKLLFFYKRFIYEYNLSGTLIKKFSRSNGDVSAIAEGPLGNLYTLNSRNGIQIFNADFEYLCTINMSLSRYFTYNDIAIMKDGYILVSTYYYRHHRRKKHRRSNGYIIVM